MKRSMTVLIFLLACAETPSSESTHFQVATVIGGDLRSRLVGRSCDGVLLLAESPTCGNHPGWFAQRLFPAALTGSPALDRYCVYRWRGAGKPTPTDYPAAGMAVDCVASVGFITSDDAADLPPDAEVMEQRQEMERRFLAHAGALDSLPRPAFPAEGGVRISVLDTARDVIPGRPGRGRSDHGRVMGLIASRLACPLAPGSACLAGIDNVLTLNTLPTEDGLETDGAGGSLTYRSHVARSIIEAVAATPPGQRSIITMSLGWHFDAGRNGPATSPMPLPERVVLEALRYARCRGSLIFAATGNTDGARPPTPGPHYPGGWQQVAAPTRQQCLSELGLAAPHDPSGPLVHALTGVDAVDAPLYNTPVGAISPLAAPGAHAYVTDPAPVLPEGVAPVREKTGSSPAAAVAAGIAATAWAYWPDRSADEIMQLLRDAAIDLGLPADYCSGVLPCGNVRRLSLCRVVAAAGVDGRTATPAPACAAAPARSLPGQIPRLAAQPADGCASRFAARGCVSNPRPLSANDLLLPVAAPTPDETICPGCSAERVFVTEIARVAAPAARRSLRLDLPINRVLSNYQIDLNGAWVRDDLGWRWLSLWNRGARGGRGGSKLDLTLDPDAEGITGPVHDVAVEFIYRYLGADADLDDQGRPASYTTTEPLFVR
jgi:hypothetical protein